MNPNIRVKCLGPHFAAVLKPANAIVKVTTGNNSHPVVDVTVTVSVSMPSMDMPDNSIICRQTAPGVYSGPVVFTMPGTWKISARALTESGQSASTNYTIVVK